MNDYDPTPDMSAIFGSMPDGQMPAGMMQLMLMTSGGMMGNPIITGDEVEFNKDGKISLPEGMTYEKAMTVLERLHDDAETFTNFTRDFSYRPNDGAVATSRVLSKRFGMVLGEAIDMGFFGTRPPESKTVYTDHDTKVQVPWGRISIPALEGVELTLCQSHGSRSGGALFHIHVEAAKKHTKVIESIFDDIDTELKTNSIYRGKAMSGSKELEFIDVSTFNAGEIVFSTEVSEQLEAGIWSLLRYTDTFREEGLRTKRTALLTGPYGTGKSSAGLMTAQIAVANGWTFLSAKPGVDNIDDVLETAKLYQPAVVFAEDVDTQTSSSDDDEVSTMLDAFDGITAKGGELVVVMTTNHKERIHKGMLRPGRLDSIIEINSLDRGSIERLIRVVVPQGKLSDSVDFDKVAEAMTGFYPAFVREAVERAKTFAVSRGKGGRNYMLDTVDLENAAHSLRPQLEMLNDAAEGEIRPSLETALGGVVVAAAQRAVHGTQVKETPIGLPYLSVPSLNGAGHS